MWWWARPHLPGSLRPVFSWACVSEKKAEGLGWTEELQLQRERWNTVLYSSTLSVGEKKLTKESVNKFLKSCWPGRSALQCDAGWETSSYQIILKHTRKCPKWRGYCDETLKLRHSRSLAVKHIFLPITISNTGQEVQLPSHSYSTNFCYMLTQFLTEDRGDGDRKNFQCLWKLVLLDLIWVIKEG